jgi:hypothetical protein
MIPHLLKRVMTRFLVFLYFLSYCTTSIGQKSDTLLFKAYKSHSLIELQIFFDNWANETRGPGGLSSVDNTTKNIYLVFEAFYNPKDISKTGGSEWGNDIYKDAKYLLIQDEVYYAIVDTLFRNGSENAIFERAIKYDTLKDFRPLITFSDAKTVILTKQYEVLLNRFLGNEHYKFATGSIMSPARSKGESEKRKEFLEKFIKIWYGHWGGYWQLHSYPYASRITFDKDFQNAVVEYRMVYEGGYIHLKNINGKWAIIKAKRTWIE